MINAILNYSFMQQALLAAILASIISGIMGTIIVEKQMISLSSGIAHASFGGIGAGYFFGVEPIITGFIFATFTSLAVAQIKKKTGANTGTIISMFWSFGMALGILFIFLTPGYPPDMTSYLFGDILLVSKTYLTIMFVITVLVLLVILPYFNYWKIYLFDEDYAKIMGINIKPFEIALYILIALTVVILIKVVGIMLSIALLSIPPALARLFTHKLNRLILVSFILSLVFTLVGLTSSYYMSIPSGASIILVGTISYFIGLMIKQIWLKKQMSA